MERVAMWRRYAERLWTGDRGDRAYRLAALTVILVGVLLRLQGQVSIISGPWLDEAVWGSRVGVQSVFSHNIRPFGFMWATKVLVNWLGPTEFWLRFIPNVASILALGLLPLLASSLLHSRIARLLLIVTFAFHPALIDLSKEFKPYSWEVFVHLAFITLYLRYRRTLRPALLYALLAALPISFAFAYNMSFAFPGLLLLAAYDGFQRWRARGVVPAVLRGVLPAVLSGVLCLALTAVVYFTLLTKVTTEKVENYWGKKYDVFYQAPVAKPLPKRVAAEEAQEGEGGAGGPEADDEQGQEDVPFYDTRLGWLLEKYSDVASLPGLRRLLWKLPVRTPAWLASAWPMADKIAWVGLHAAGLVALLLARRFRELILLWLPLGCLVVCNAFGVWPMGAFRTNLFLCAYALPLAAVGADALIVGSNLRAWVLAGSLSLVYLAPGVAFGHDYSGRKQMWTRHIAGRAMLERLKAWREQQLAADPKAAKVVVLLDMHGSRPLNYYLGVHPETSAQYGKYFRDNFRLKLRRLTKRDIGKEMTRQKGDAPVLIVASKKLELVETVLNANFRVLSSEHIEGEHLIAVIARKRAR